MLWHLEPAYLAGYMHLHPEYLSLASNCLPLPKRRRQLLDSMLLSLPSKRKEERQKVTHWQELYDAAALKELHTKWTLVLMDIVAISLLPPPGNCGVPQR